MQFCSILQHRFTSLLYFTSVLLYSLHFSTLNQFCFSSLIFCYFTSILFYNSLQVSPHFYSNVFSCMYISAHFYFLVFQFTNILFCFTAVLFCKFRFSVIQYYKFYLTSTLLYSQRKVNITSVILCYVALYHCSIIFCKFYCSVSHHLTSILIYSLVYFIALLFYSVLFQCKTLFSVSLQFCSLSCNVSVFYKFHFTVLFHVTTFLF